MKKFFKIVLAVIVGIILANFVTILIFASIAGSASSEKTPSVPAEGILKIDMSKIMVEEQAVETINLQAFGNADMPVPLGLRQSVNAIEYAASDNGVKCIYLKPEGASLGIASIVEFRNAIGKFRASGKPVIAYLENVTTGNYYLASVADKVYLGSYQGGNPMFNGISGRMLFLKDLLDELGIRIQLIRHGKYKSAGEMYVRNSSSPENYEQTKAYIDGIWNTFSAQIAESRGISVEKLNAAIDGLRLCLPSDFLEYGLADELLDREGLEDKLAVMAGKDSFDEVSMIPFADYVKAKSTSNFRSRNKIAVIYANGEIVDGLDLQNVDGDRFASIVETVRRDSTIKAVVLRVNSPGGSVVASEKIKSELDKLKAVKPLVASYGDYAASGGYWISNNADKIYCDPTTITGSIGVFGMVPDFSVAVKGKLKIGVESVSSNRHGDMWTLMRPLDKDEYAYMQRSIENIYDKFVSAVAEGRSLDEGYVDGIAQGRVWIGTDALKIGLVDEMGSLEDALAYAALAAGFEDVKSCYIDEYPRQLTLTEQLSLMFSQTQDNDYSINSAFNLWYDNWQKGKCETAFARLPFQLTIR